ncbi:MAG: hypothetical protein NVSMB65_10740 [Chloroflexota bacterium]
MPKKSFSFGPSARQRGAGEPAPDIDREILRKTVDDGVRALENARIVPIGRVQPDPEQPRRSFDDASLNELATSIRAEGILQPLWVQYRYAEDDYMIISGERRYRAALLAGLNEVPVLIGNVGATTRFLHQLIENLQREDLNALDRGQALARLKTMLPGTWQDVSEMVGLTRRRVEQLRALARLSEPLQVAVRSGALTEDHARAITRLPVPLHEPLAIAVVKHRLSTRRTKDLVRRLHDSAERWVLAEGDAAPALGARVRAFVDAEAAAIGLPDHPAYPDPVTRAARPRSRAAIPVYEKALDFERVLDRMPVLEYQEDRALLNDILSRIAAKIAAIETLSP